jgi:hypothetical protein
MAKKTEQRLLAGKGRKKVPRGPVRSGLPCKVCLTIYNPGKGNNSLENGLVAIATALDNGSMRKDVARDLSRRLLDYCKSSC